MWNGSIVPSLRKHRDGCGDITNHIQVKGYYLDQVFNVVRARVGFEEEDQEYIYEFNYFGPEEELKSDRVMREVVRQIKTPEQDTSQEV